MKIETKKEENLCSRNKMKDRNKLRRKESKLKRKLIRQDNRQKMLYLSKEKILRKEK